MEERPESEGSMKIAVIGANGHQGRKHVAILKSIGIQPLEIEIGMERLTCDAAIICTPTPTHFEIAEDYLKWGIPVLVEKPLCETAEQVKRLCAYPHALSSVNFNQRFFNGLPVKSFGVKKLRAIRNTTRQGLGSLAYRLGIHDVDIWKWRFPNLQLVLSNTTANNERKMIWENEDGIGVGIDWYTDPYTLQKSVFAFLIQVASKTVNPMLATFEQSIPVLEYLESLPLVPQERGDVPTSFPNRIHSIDDVPPADRTSDKIS